MAQHKCGRAAARTPIIAISHERLSPSHMSAALVRAALRGIRPCSFSAPPYGWPLEPVHTQWQQETWNGHPQ